MKININLKKTRYNSRFEGLVIAIIGGILCAIFLYGMLTNRWDKSYDGAIIVGFVLFGGCLLLGLWKFINNKPSEYIDINGWKYQVFRKVNRYQFILISGGMKVLEMVVCLSVLCAFHLIKIKGDDISISFILLMLLLIVVYTIIFGYIQYQKYSSIDMDSEFDGLFKS